MKIYMMFAGGSGATWLIDAVDEYSLEQWSSDEAYWKREGGPLSSHDILNYPVRVVSVEVSDAKMLALFDVFDAGEVEVTR